MALKIYGKDVISNARVLTAKNVDKINSHETWSYVGSYTKGPTWDSFSSVDVNLSTQNVQPTTVNFSDAWFEFKCIAHGGASNQTFNANVEYRFGSTGQWFRLIQSTSGIKVGFKAVLHVRTFDNTTSGPQSRITPYTTDPNVSDTLTNQIMAVEDYNGTDIEIRWPPFGNASLTFLHSCWWR